MAGWVALAGPIRPALIGFTGLQAILPDVSPAYPTTFPAGSSVMPVSNEKRHAEHRMPSFRPASDMA